MSKAKIIELDETNTCQLCENALAKYTCPKCQIRYCKLTCYQSDKHLECSEEFYKNCITENLALEKNEESRQQMLEILKRNQESDDSELDSDDDEEIDDITERLKGVDLDNADEIWDKLTQDEQQEFIAFLKSEDVTKLVPPWSPWWLHTSQNVEEVETSDDYKKECPPIIEIKDFKKISKKPPAECVRFNLINILAAYVFATRYFNGEHHDFAKEVATCIITISQTLRNNQNFEDYETARKSVELQCIETDWIVTDQENFTLLHQDLQKLQRGPNSSSSNYYILCALSDLHSLFISAMKKKTERKRFSKTFPNDHFPQVKYESNNKIKNCLKKIEYLLSYSKDFISG